MLKDNILHTEYRQGASHKPDNKPCQDYALGFSDDNLRIIALSDGHGGDKYLRSNYGSEIAVQVAINALRSFCKRIQPDDIIKHDEDFFCQGVLTQSIVSGSRREKIMRHLFQHICSEWHRLIREHFDSNRFTSEELSFLQKIKAVDYYLDSNNEVIDNHLPSAYGCTLIAVAYTSKFWIAFQIGDGKCVSFNEDGTWNEPIPWDDKCFQNITTSLSKQDYESFRYCVGHITPPAIFIASDGMDDSYQPMANLVDSYGNYFLWPMLKHGFDAFKANLPEILDRISEIGSKDDMSVGYIVNQALLKPTMENFLMHTLRALNYNIQLKDDEIGNLGIQLDRYSKDIENSEKESKVYHQNRERVWDELMELNNSMEEIERRKPKTLEQIKKSLKKGCKSLLDRILRKEKEDDDKYLNEKAELEKKVNQVAESYEEYAQKILDTENNLKLFKEKQRVLNSKRERLQKEYEDLTNIRDEIGERIEFLKNGTIQTVK